MKIPEFDTKIKLFDFLIENKDTLIAAKKAEIKHADGFMFVHAVDSEGEIKTNKANEPINISEVDKLEVIAIINTTNLMDSHMDVHLPGIWNKSLQENKFIMHIQEHKMSSFDKIISEGKDLKVFVKNFTWKELGFDFEGKTQALVFKSIVRKSRNAFMFDQYAKGFVKNHSVGMRYVKLLLAINNESYGAEFEAWEKYFPKVANKETAENKGYFWVVKEARVIEGSAVPLGSNFVTPTLNVEAKEEIQTQTQKNIQILKEILKVMKEPKQDPFSDNQISDTQKELDFLRQLK